MRSTLEILIALDDCAPVSENEAKMALLALAGINHFTFKYLQELLEIIKSDGITGRVALKASFIGSSIERILQAKKSDPTVWLGPASIPGTVEHAERRRWGQKILDRFLEKPKQLQEMTEPELRDLMNRCGQALKCVLGYTTLFALLVFDDPKMAQYISSCERASMIEAMKECVARLESRGDLQR